MGTNFRAGRMKLFIYFLACFCKNGSSDQLCPDKDQNSNWKSNTFVLKTTSKKEKRVFPLPSSYGSLKCKKKNVLEKLFKKTYILLKTSGLDIPSFNAGFSGISEVYLELPAQRPGTWIPLTNPHLLLWVERALAPLKTAVQINS